MERWKDIVGFEGIYQVSNLGNIKSLSRKVKNKQGFRTTKEKILDGHVDQYGYHIVYLVAPNVKMRRRRVHRLVAEHFIPNTENRPNINHKNGIKTDNCKENLEWCTQKENVQHALSTGLSDGRNGSVLTKVDVLYIKQLLSTDMTQADIAEMFGVSRGTITDINIGKTWKNV